MHRLASRLRKPAIFLTGLVSAGLCLALIWVFAPAFFNTLRTGELVLMLGLIVLPAVTWWAIRADRAQVERVKAYRARVHEGGRDAQQREERAAAHERPGAARQVPLN